MRYLALGRGLQFEGVRRKYDYSYYQRRVFCRLYYRALVSGLYVKWYDWLIGKDLEGGLIEEIQRNLLERTEVNREKYQDFYIFISGGETEFTWYCGHRLLHQPLMIDNGDCGTNGGMKIGRGNRSTRRKPTPAPLCPLQTPHDQPSSNPGRRVEKPATNRLSHDTASKYQASQSLGNIRTEHLPNTRPTNYRYATPLSK
jgi:hypothetical protein